MQIIKADGCQSTPAHKFEPVTIVINTEMPDLPTAAAASVDDTLAAYDAEYSRNAQGIFEALRDSLPGGTLDRLVGLLLQYKASHFTVSYERAPISPADQVIDEAVAAKGNSHLTEAQRRLVALDLRKAEIIAYYDELESTLKAIAEESGLNSYFRDDDGIVYKITIPDGKFVSFKPYDYVRTKREGERAGTLSMKEAATVFPPAPAF